MLGSAGGAAEFERNMSSSTAADVYDDGEGGGREGQRSQREDPESGGGTAAVIPNG